MRIIIIANTYYQLIFSVQLKKTMFRNDEVTLLISDHSNNAKAIKEKVDDCGIFTNVYYVESFELLRQIKPFSGVKQFIDICFKDKNSYSTIYLKDVSDLFFDEIVLYNIGRDSVSLFNTLSKRNKEVRLSRYEEGILSYNNRMHTIITKKRLIMDCVREIQRKAPFTKSGRNFYCFYPELYKGELTPVKVPLIEDNSETSELIKKIFNVNLSKDDYKEKYIFFTSVYDFEGEHPIGEFELVCRIAERVGKENLLIKIHPRDRRTVYSDNGFKVDRNSDIPWEAIQLSGDFGDKVFLTATSGSVLSGSFMSSSPPKTFYLYQLCNIDGNSTAEESRKSINTLLNSKEMQHIFSKIKIIKTLEEL